VVQDLLRKSVELDSLKSEVRNISLGVLQGSILGPLLFTIYVNDLDNSSHFFSFIKYADDTTLLHIIQHSNDSEIATQINHELHMVYKWLCANKLSLNIAKTRYMVFHNIGKSITNIANLQLNNKNIEKVQTFNFLGIHIDEHLKWKSHVANTALKLSRTVGILVKLRHHLPPYILKTIYQSLFVSHISYGILAWGNHSDKLFLLQKKAIRLITNSNYLAHTDPLFKISNCLKIHDIYFLNILKFYFAYCHGILPNYFMLFDFSLRSNVHDYNTRCQNRLNIPRTRTKLADSCLRVAVPKTVNNTVPNILDKIYTHSRAGYVLYIKQCFLENYCVTCLVQNCYVCGRI
jgi:hypothetical protein